MRLWIIVFFLLALAGCKIGETYQRPDFESPERYDGAYGQQSADPADSLGLARMSWRGFFKDSTLVALIDTALSGNIDLQKAVQQIEMSYQDLKQAKAEFYPSLGAGADVTKEYFSENFNNYGSNRSRVNHGEDAPRTLYTERSAFALGLYSSWEIDVWGKFRNQQDAVRAEFLQRTEFKKALQTALVAEIASAYYNLLMINAQKEVAERNLRLSDSTIRIVRLQYDAGEATSLAIQQTESQRLRARTLIPQLEREYKIQENRLNSLLGRPPQPIDITADLSDLDPENDYRTGVPLELVNNRPDVAASEYALIASNAQAGIAQAMRYPSLTIDAGLGLNSYQLSSVFDPAGSAFALLNGGLFQPIFQNRRLKTNHEKALLARQVAQLDFKEKLLTAINEVSDALVMAETLEEETRIAQERITVTRKGVEDASLLFRSGFANYLEVITAQEDALQSELDLVNLKMQEFLANIELYRSLGGGWE